ncbi:LAO/AO transport system kinase [Frankineae bacterium MT45]|nr:LAO/AO transport system kinase [Frankineae bacterium MT45]
MRSTSVSDLVERTRSGDPRSVARLISLVENDAPQLREIAALLVPLAGRARVVGLTGSPGVGKSTSTSALIGELRRAEKRVGVLAVDPSSPFSGGALLGDRVRMQEHSTDEGVFIRSMASRGHLGGLAAAAAAALRVLDVAGCDVVLIETVGVGQAEVDIASLADTTMVLLAPGMGDGIQAAKAGILEIADIFVANKADRDGADQVARDLRHMQSLGHSDRRDSTAGDRTTESAPQVPERWRAPIVKTVAARGEGVAEVVAAIDAHHEWMTTTGELVRRRQRRAAAEIEAIALAQVSRRFAHLHGADALQEAAVRVVERSTDPYTAADELVAAIGQ